MKHFTLLFVISFLVQFETLAGEKLFQSGDKQVSVIELYSSEGCSSCPPADRWLAGLKGHSKLWKEFIPLNFHVDYWDRLGWVDKYANQSFSQRQRRYAGEWGSGRVYTPGFVRNGKEWRAQKLANLLGPEVGQLSVEKTSDTQISVTFQPKKLSEKANYKVHVALLGNGITTQVKHGENAGEKLSHEFVVLKKESKSLEKSGKILQANMSIPKNDNTNAKNYSLVVWVTQGRSQKPIQATGGMLAKN